MSPLLLALLIPAGTLGVTLVASKPVATPATPIPPPGVVIPPVPGGVPATPGAPGVPILAQAQALLLSTLTNPSSVSPDQLRSVAAQARAAGLIDVANQLEAAAANLPTGGGLAPVQGMNPNGGIVPPNTAPAGGLSLGGGPVFQGPLPVITPFPTGPAIPPDAKTLTLLQLRVNNFQNSLANQLKQNVPAAQINLQPAVQLISDLLAAGKTDDAAAVRATVVLIASAGGQMIPTLPTEAIPAAILAQADNLRNTAIPSTTSAQVLNFIARLQATYPQPSPAVASLIALLVARASQLSSLGK